MNAYTLGIAGLTLRLETEQLLHIGLEFLPFLVQTEKPDYTAVFQCVDALPLATRMET